MYPRGVMRGQSDGHCWNTVLDNGQQLDVTQVEVILITKPAIFQSFSIKLQLFVFIKLLRIGFNRIDSIYIGTRHSLARKINCNCQWFLLADLSSHWF